MEDLIREDLKKHTFPYAVCMENFIGDFNIGTVIRNANAFGVQEVFYVGQKKWDRRGAVGTYHYTSVNFLSSYDQLVELKNKYSFFVGVDNIPGSVPMDNYEWKSNSLLIFGEEGCGLTPITQSLCDDIVAIKMFGSVRSLNCGTASGIVMNNFISRIK